MSRPSWKVLLLLTATLLPAQDMSVLKNLKWRSIGPFRGGRVAAVTGVESQPNTFYFGGAAGGVWKTVNSGANWECITDGKGFGTASIGGIAGC